MSEGNVIDVFKTQNNFQSILIPPYKLTNAFHSKWPPQKQAIMLFNSILLDVFYFFVSECCFMKVWALHAFLVPAEVRRGCWIYWNWSGCQLWEAMWALGIEPKPSARISALRSCAIPQALKTFKNNDNKININAWAETLLKIRRHKKLGTYRT